jgi:hypothetical protein
VLLHEITHQGHVLSIQEGIDLIHQEQGWPLQLDHGEDQSEGGHSLLSTRELGDIIDSTFSWRLGCVVNGPLKWIMSILKIKLCPSSLVKG